MLLSENYKPIIFLAIAIQDNSHVPGDLRHLPSFILAFMPIVGDLYSRMPRLTGKID